jgi:hypothetical protein
VSRHGSPSSASGRKAELLLHLPIHRAVTRITSIVLAMPQNCALDDYARGTNDPSRPGALPIRADAQNFLRMIGHMDGRFICLRCGHVGRPNDRDFFCNCGRCLELSRFGHRLDAMVAG